MFLLKRHLVRDILYCLLIGLALVIVVSMLRQSDAAPSYSYGEVRALLESEAVSKVKVTERSAYLYLKEPIDGESVVTYSFYDFSLFYNDFNDLLAQQLRDGTLKDYDYPARPSNWGGALLTVLFVVAMLGLLWYILAMRQSRNNNGGGGGGGRLPQFGRARTRTLSETGKRVTFDDVAGADEEKEELQEIVEFLRNPSRFMNLGARIPKGVLLVGPPGTGKTLIARAVAGEADVNFLSISGSDFVELYVGVGASRVRDLFKQAKESAPSIVFIDEIDAVGRQRGTGVGGGHDEREQTLNQLLVEMDGFVSNEGVIVLAATNRADILDPALLRPGRFDRQVYVGLPDLRGREAVLKVHAREKLLAEDVELTTVAKATSGFTGADLENLMNEAALLSARRNQPFITKETLHEAMLKVIAGPEKRSRVIPQQARVLTAYHEAGHAVVIHSLPSQDPVHQITIIPRGPAGGMTISLPREDQPYRSRKELTERVTACLGGRVAEELILGDSSTGAAGDLQTATHIARSMVTKYGMSPHLGTIAFDDSQEVFIGRSMSSQRTYSEEVAGKIDQEIKAIIDGCYEQCRAILTQNRQALEVTAQYLLEHETMSDQQFELVFQDPEALNAPGPVAPEGEPVMADPVKA